MMKILVTLLLFPLQVICQDFWQQTCESADPLINSIAVTPEGNLLVTNDDGWIHRSTNGGESWNRFGSRVSEFPLRSVITNSNGDIFVSSKRYQVSPTQSMGSGVFRSTDHGSTWTELNLGLPNDSLLYSVPSFNISQSGEIYAGTMFHGVIRSTDNGDTWEHNASGFPLSPVRAIGLDQDNHIFACTENLGIYRSTDGGSSWSSINDSVCYDSFYGRFSTTAIAITPAGEIFIGGGAPGIFRSTDDGDHWTRVDDPAENKFITAFAIGHEGNIFAGSSHGLYLSADGGTSWTRSSSFSLDSDFLAVWSLGVTPDGGIFAGTYDSGVKRSTDNGATWHFVNANLTLSNTEALVVLPDGDYLMGTYNQGTLRSSDRGVNWNPHPSPLDTSFLWHFLIDNEGGMFAGVIGPSGGTYKSTDNGQTWQKKSNKIGGPYAVNSHGVLFGVGAGLQRSTDNGESWTLTPNSGYIDVRTVVVTPSDDILIGTEVGVARSTDNGQTWTQLGGQKGVDMMYLSPNGYLFTYTPQYGPNSGLLYRSGDEGASWTQINLNLDYHCRVRDLLFNSNGTLFAATTEEGVYRSIDNGDTWTPVNSGLTSFKCSSFAIDSTGHLIVGTAGGVFRSTETTISPLAISPLAAHFGDVLTGSLKSETMVLTNKSSSTMNISSISSNNVDFSVSPNTATLTPSESKTFTISFNPSSAGTKMVSLTFTHDGLNSPITIALDGKGTHETYSTSVANGWNIISLPFMPYDQRRSSVFPSSTAGAFSFNDEYTKCDSLEPGTGYWIKFSQTASVVTEGIHQTINSVDVHPGWNLIGSFSSVAATQEILSEPAGNMVSPIYGYRNRYYVAESLATGEGYWVKCTSSGKLSVSGSLASSKMAHSPDLEESLRGLGRLTVSDASGKSQSLYFGLNASKAGLVNLSELPPIPPEGSFDVRYSTNSLVSLVDPGSTHKSAVLISSAQYPVTIGWESSGQGIDASLNFGGMKASLETDGTIRLSSEQPIALDLDGSRAMRALPKNFSLSQNYPNPFNPMTRIEYSLPIQSRVVLKVFNLLGEEVRTLVSETQDAGFQSIEFDAAGLPSGIYVYKLTAGDFSDVKKMLVVK